MKGHIPTGKNFATAIGRAMQTCKTLGVNIDDHFREVTKMITLGSGLQLFVVLST